MGTMDNPQVRTWSDSMTVGWSNIEHLQFAPSYEWTNLEITIQNTSHTGAPVTLHVAADNENIGDYQSTIKKNQSERLSYEINGRKSINITGYLSGGVQTRAVKITAMAYWKEDAARLKTESVSARFETAGTCMLHDIWLPAARRWEMCQVLVEGMAMKSSCCRFALLQDGALNGSVQTVTLNGSDSAIIPYTDINARVPLVVAGTLSNYGVVFGAGAKITLTGFYREGES